MKEHPLLDQVRLVRRDVGNLLFHFTRAHESKPAADVLAQILKEGVLRAGSLHVRGGYSCLCFTEAPITELVATFSLVKFASSKMERIRYEPYGIAVQKEWLFARGGRPVIYQPESEFNLLPTASRPLRQRTENHACCRYYNYEQKSHDAHAPAWWRSIMGVLVRDLYEPAISVEEKCHVTTSCLPLHQCLAERQ